MMNSGEKYLVMVALTVGVLLLVAPVVPPQGALFGFFALLILGGSLLLGYRAIVLQLSALSESEPSNQPTDPIEDIQQQYIEGDLTDQELETELEDHEDALNNQ